MWSDVQKQHTTSPVARSRNYLVTQQYYSLPANNATMYTRILSDHMRTLLSQITACRWCSAYLMTPCQSVNRKIYGRNHANARTFNKIRYGYTATAAAAVVLQAMETHNETLYKAWNSSRLRTKVTSSLPASSSTCQSVAGELIQIIATSPHPLRINNGRYKTPIKIANNRQQPLHRPQPNRSALNAQILALT